MIRQLELALEVIDPKHLLKNMNQNIQKDALTWDSAELCGRLGYWKGVGKTKTSNCLERFEERMNAKCWQS